MRIETRIAAVIFAVVVVGAGALYFGSDGGDEAGQPGNDTSTGNADGQRPEAGVVTGDTGASDPGQITTVDSSDEADTDPWAGTADTETSDTPSWDTPPGGPRAATAEETTPGSDFTTHSGSPSSIGVDVDSDPSGFRPSPTSSDGLSASGDAGLDTTGSDDRGDSAPVWGPTEVSVSHTPSYSDLTAGGSEGSDGSEAPTAPSWSSPYTSYSDSATLDTSPIDDEAEESSTGSASAERTSTTTDAETSWGTADTTGTPVTTGTSSTFSGTETSTTVGRTHVIKSGDTFSSLAEQYLGHTKYVGLIEKANPDMDPRRLQINARVNIPPRPAASSTTGASTPTGGGLTAMAPSSDIPADRSHKVQKNETWYGLAQQYLGSGGRWTELYEFNRERGHVSTRDREVLRVGTVIELPKDAIAARP